MFRVVGSRVVHAALAAALAAAWPARAAAGAATDPAPQPATRPGRAAQAMLILRDNCVSCHNPDKKKGSLLLTSRESALKGNDDGPVLVPGRSVDSRLAQALLPDA